MLHHADHVLVELLNVSLMLAVNQFQVMHFTLKLCVIKLEMSGEILISPTFKICPHLTIYMLHVICPCTVPVCILLSTCHSEVLCGKFTLF